MKRLGLLLLTCLILTPAATTRRESFDFRYDILPILHRQGCGSAYCHGSATGIHVSKFLFHFQSD